MQTGCQIKVLSGSTFFAQRGLYYYNESLYKFAFK